MKKYNGILGVFILIAIALLIWQPESHREYEMKTTDRPERIISLSPSNTEILFAIGAGERVVGVTEYCDYPEEALTRDKVGNFIQVDMEKVISLRPDLVIANPNLQESAVQQLRRAGIRVETVRGETIRDVVESIQLIGEWTGNTNEATELKERLERKREAILDLVPQEKPLRVFVEVWEYPLLTVGTESYLNDILVQLGAVNVAGNEARDYYGWDAEKLYASDPDVYLRVRAIGMGTEGTNLPPILHALRVKKEGKVILLEDNIFVRSGPRSLDAMELIAKALYEKE